MGCFGTLENAPSLSRGAYNESEDGAPARLKGATSPQVGKWSELASWLDRTERPYLLWRLVDARPPQYCPDDGCEKCNRLKAERA